MSEHLVSPDRSIEIGGQQYTLDGSFRTLKAIQHAFDCEILTFLVERTGDLPFDAIARVFRLAIPGNPPPLEVIEQAVVEEVGIVEARRLLGEWLFLATQPKKDREKKAKLLASALDAQTKSPASRGRNTAGSA